MKMFIDSDSDARAVREFTKEMQNAYWFQNYLELLHYEWKDYEDFERKYGTENHLEAATKRFSMWTVLNSRGAMLRNGVWGIKDLYDSVGASVIWMWEKYRPIIEEVRGSYAGQHFFLRDFEFYAGEMYKYVKTLDPSFESPDTFDKYVPDK